jgi:hypothetical protein
MWSLKDFCTRDSFSKMLVRGTRWLLSWLMGSCILDESQLYREAKSYCTNMKKEISSMVTGLQESIKQIEDNKDESYRTLAEDQLKTYKERLDEWHSLQTTNDNYQSTLSARDTITREVYGDIVDMFNEIATKSRKDQFMIVHAARSLINSVTKLDVHEDDESVTADVLTTEEKAKALGDASGQFEIESLTEKEGAKLL